ncbi:hypothetical protein JB92DRAFT_3108350 [Gautieria morchelliformis]|nr:hypothetical protein JB92DRAFT_3108350 [Gautieria morchelliformis]
MDLVAGCGPRDNVPQTTDPPSDSVEKWANEEESIGDDDILLFVTMGVNHIPRPEDWPVYVFVFLSLPTIPSLTPF